MADIMSHYAVRFVCMGNVCRRPTAQGVFQHKVHALGLQKRVTVDCAGSHNDHPDAPADARSQQHAKRRGYDL